MISDRLKFERLSAFSIDVHKEVYAEFTNTEYLFLVPYRSSEVREGDIGCRRTLDGIEGDESRNARLTRKALITALGAIHAKKSELGLEIRA